MVPSSEREAYEAAVRTEGFSGFFISEIDDNGAMLPATGRDVYYPVSFVEPLEGNEAALGFDLGQTHAIDQILDQRVCRMYGVDTE